MNKHLENSLVDLDVDIHVIKGEMYFILAKENIKVKYWPKKQYFSFIGDEFVRITQNKLLDVFKP